ncbi:MAG: hypothetical protein GXW99_00785 [Clostridiales bacterium]|nr:hypothetical protein [Clostridiales bacterium]
MELVKETIHKGREENRFMGWYHKLQRGDDTIAFIPGRAGDGAFVQVIDTRGSRQFSVPNLSANGTEIQAGSCRFSDRGIMVNLPGIRGQIDYGSMTPLASDIMGPFRHFPMECRHGVVSMDHSLSGKLWVDGEERCFDGGKGYVEWDRGRSFPSAYLWMQCNDFDGPCAIMLSIARIPFAACRFTGCICSVIWAGQEFRLATYNGVRICAGGPARITLSQGKLLLSVEVTGGEEGYPLLAPIAGQMTQTIRESHQASVRCRLWRAGQLCFDVHSRHASFEYVPGTS